MKAAVFWIVFATALIGFARGEASCSLDKQFITFQMDCDVCPDGVNNATCCHMLAGKIDIMDSNNVSCCSADQPPTFLYGLAACQLTSDCYERFYGKYLSDLSLYINDTEKDFSSCRVLQINTTPAYQTTTLCVNCTSESSTPGSSSSAANIPSVLFITICQLLWIGFAS